MPTIEAAREMQRQFNEEGRKFTIPVLWVDDDGVAADKLKLFSKAGNFRVTVATSTKAALTEWVTGNHAALIVDHRIGFHDTGDQVVHAIIDTSIIPAMIAVVSSHLPDSFLADYAPYVTREQVFQKDMPYGAIGQQFRQLTEDSLAADGMSPQQLNVLDSIKPSRSSSL